MIGTAVSRKKRYSSTAYSNLFGYAVLIYGYRFEIIAFNERSGYILREVCVAILNLAVCPAFYFVKSGQWC